MVNIFPPKDGNATTSTGVAGGTVNRVFLHLGSHSIAIEIRVEFMKLIYIVLVQPMFGYCTNVKIREETVEV